MSEWFPRSWSWSRRLRWRIGRWLKRHNLAAAYAEQDAQ